MEIASNRFKNVNSRILFLKSRIGVKRAGDASQYYVFCGEFFQ